MSHASEPRAPLLEGRSKRCRTVAPQSVTLQLAVVSRAVAVVARRRSLAFRPCIKIPVGNRARFMQRFSEHRALVKVKDGSFGMTSNAKSGSPVAMFASRAGAEAS